MTTSSKRFRSLLVAVSLASLAALGFAGDALAKKCECETCECCAGSLCYSQGWCSGNQQCTCSGWVQGCA